MDIELAKLVAEDLDYLTKEWNQDIDDASLRRASPVLRSLLIEGHLAKIAHAVGKELRIMAPAINKVITEVELKKLKYFQSGGAKYKGMQVQCISFEMRAKTSAEIKADYERTKNVIGQSYPVKLNVFLRQSSFSIDGTIIYRDEVIKYVANKLGGAHYDSSRAAGVKSEPTLDDKYALLDKARVENRIADKNSIYYEILSIGQRVVNSRDVRNLRKQLNTIVNLPSVIYVG